MKQKGLVGALAKKKESNNFDSLELIRKQMLGSEPLGAVEVN